MKESRSAHLVVKNAWRLSRIRELRQVYIKPDLNKDDREKQKRLRGELVKKIAQFPEQHWVVKQGVVTSMGKHTMAKKLDSEDEGKELDRSYCY